MLHVIGESYSGDLPPLTATQRELGCALRAHVEALAGAIGERHIGRPAALARASAYVGEAWASAGLDARAEPFAVGRREVANIVAEQAGVSHPGRLLVVGAHYDTVPGCPGANDNGTGVAALLEMARALRTIRLGCTVRWVAFVNEEPPYFQTAAMGSLVHARAARARGDDISGMLSLETLGHYSQVPGSQQYPGGLSAQLPTTGNFIGLVADLASRAWLEDVTQAFRAHARFPSQAAAAPADTPGVGWSDHWAFWQQGYPAAMITDTAPFRYLHYHTAQDTPDKIDYDSLVRVVDGLTAAIRHLGGAARL